ncbi:MAG: 2-hydroxyhepta-2,4-diene-1,7-dioate isomerase [Rhodospirillaceae bacterium]|nr:2-hydroxyhepta-2,4-diene-1,7-dioate isomerase [Rhodospirillaceae bacterium]|tara:strand:- start:3663 stop:4514 length:852 start_codon:yes stop_codon:yes gene_type:complete
MKLVRYGNKDAESPGLIDSLGKLRDLSGEVEDITPEVLAPEKLSKLRLLDHNSLPQITEETRLGIPLKGIPKIVAVGQNYLGHIAEMGYEPPREPVIFNKAVSSLLGPFDPMIKPLTSIKMDYEVELAAIFSKPALNVSTPNALSYVAGYAVMNDGSERYYQKERAGGTTKGKSCDTFGPLGPWLVTSDEIVNPQQLRIWTKINGELRQDSNTSEMVFSIAQLISYVSEFMSFQPGDVLTTGSPHGVGGGFDPPKWLQPGDIIEMGIDGLGQQRHEVLAYSSQ